MIKALLLGISVLLLPVAAQAQVEFSVHLKAKLVIKSNHSLFPQQKKRFAKFRSGSPVFYSAYYVNTKTDNFFTMTDEHSLEDAQSQGKFGCEMVSPKESRGACVLYAVVVPAGNPTKGIKIDRSISQNLGLELRRVGRNFERGTFGAIAVNHAGVWAINWGNQSAGLAAEHALESCFLDTDDPQRKAYYAQALFDFVNKKRGFGCEVILTVSPK